LAGPLRENNKQLAQMPGHTGMKTNNSSLFEMRNYNVVNEDFNVSLFEMTLTIAKELKYHQVKMGCKTNH